MSPPTAEQCGFRGPDVAWLRSIRPRRWLREQEARDALQDTAIFDVLLPPYDDRAGRSCHYYAETAASSRARESSQQPDAEPLELEEVGWPPGLRVVSEPYRGPMLQ